MALHAKRPLAHHPTAGAESRAGTPRVTTTNGIEYRVHGIGGETVNHFDEILVLVVDWWYCAQSAHDRAHIIVPARGLPARGESRRPRVSP
jgi:hypothetical protein